MSDRTYEVLFIADPNLGEPEVDALTAQVQGFIEKENGKVTKVEKWGKKRLAYEVKKQREGYYVLLAIEARPESVKELERRLRVTDAVIKFLTVRIDETLKRLEKRRKHREKRAHRKATAAPAPAQPSVASQMLGTPEEAR